MSVESKIEWTDASWSPVVGCSKVSDGCKNCYAINHAWRLGHNPNEKINSVYNGLTKKNSDGSLNWTGEVREIWDRLSWPIRIKTHKRIFVNPMADLFHEKVSDEFIYKVFEIILLADWHTFQVLTKRPERMAKLLPSIMFNLKRNYPKGFKNVDLNNLWLGATTENQDQFDQRTPHLMQIKNQFPWLVIFVSCEPLLGEINFTKSVNFTKSDEFSSFNYLSGCGIDSRLPTQTIPNVFGSKLDWVILGSESGKGARPMNEDWVKWIIKQCELAGSKVFYKQKLNEKGKKVSLPILDGRQWVEMPEAVR